MLYYAPPITPQDLHRQDKLKRDWDTRTRDVANVKSESWPDGYVMKWGLLFPVRTPPPGTIGERLTHFVLNNPGHTTPELLEMSDDPTLTKARLAAQLSTTNSSYGTIELRGPRNGRTPGRWYPSTRIHKDAS